jgi:hypothetical protein
MERMEDTRLPTSCCDETRNIREIGRPEKRGLDKFRVSERVQVPSFLAK